MATTAFYDMAIQVPGHPLVRSVVFEGSPDGAAGVSVDRVQDHLGPPVQCPGSAAR